MIKARTPFTAERIRNDVTGAPATMFSSQGIYGVSEAAASHAALLERFSGMEAKFDRFLKVDRCEIERIQVEISDIAGRIQSTKAEIAALRHPLETNGKLETAAAELGAVVSDTETATNSIMSQAERLEDILGEVIAELPAGFATTRLGDAREIIVKIYEACNFQDITGQRINKVVRTIAFIEERVDAMIAMWNATELATMPMSPGLDRMDGDLELSGPVASSGAAQISQDDIDALFA